MTGQRIAITGSSGMIGGALSASLRERGDTVIRLVRRHPVGPQEARMPDTGTSTGNLADVLSNVDAVVNLAGAGIGDHRWTSSYKESLRASRLDTTSALVDALAQVDRPVRLVSGSAIGFYGDRGDEVLDESSAPGEDFLAQLCVDWEAAAGSAGERHPTAFARTGLVMAPRGGAFQPLALATRFGLGGPLGSGRQWWSWVTLRDEVRALVFLIDHPEITGPVNIVSPRSGRQGDLSRALGRSMRRPAVARVPAPVLDVVLGEMASQVTASTRVRPAVLAAAGFTWLDSNQDQALDRLVADIS